MAKWCNKLFPTTNAWEMASDQKYYLGLYEEYIANNRN